VYNIVDVHVAEMQQDTLPFFSTSYTIFKCSTKYLYAVLRKWEQAACYDKIPIPTSIFMLPYC